TLRGIFELIRLEPQSSEETATLARALIAQLSEEGGLGMDGECVGVALYSARQYLSAANFPGPVLDLIKATAARALKRGERAVAAHEVVVTLAQLTGLPISILDNKERVDLAAVHAYFSSRVIGQDEAVAAIVDRIAMLKAGLNDPARPIGVFLFAGSTGTGKTELAKASAEYPFGSGHRLIRVALRDVHAPAYAHKITPASHGGPGTSTP